MDRRAVIRSALLASILVAGGLLVVSLARWPSPDPAGSEGPPEAPLAAGPIEDSGRPVPASWRFGGRRPRRLPRTAPRREAPDAPADPRPALADLFSECMESGDYSRFLSAVAALKSPPSQDSGGDSAGYSLEVRQAFLENDPGLPAALLREGRLMECAALAEELGLPDEVVRALLDKGRAFEGLDPPPEGAEGSPDLGHIGLRLREDLIAQALREREGDDEEIVQRLAERLIEAADLDPGRIDLGLFKTLIEEGGGDALRGRLEQEVEVRLGRAREEAGTGEAGGLEPLFDALRPVEELLSPEKRREALGALAGLCREDGDRPREIEVLKKLGTLSVKEEAFDGAIEAYERILALEEESEDGRARTQALLALRDACFDGGREDRARECHGKIVALYEQAGDGGSLKSLGQDCLKKGAGDLARDAFERCLAIHRAAGKLGAEGQVLIDLGNVYLEDGDYSKTLELYEEGLVLQRQAGDRLCEAITTHNIGVVHARKGDYRMALERYEQALPIYRERGYGSGEADTLLNCGIAYWKLGEPEEALRDCGKALEKYIEKSDLRGQAKSLRFQAEMREAAGEADAAAELEEKARAIDPGKRWTR
jgi:tetratricopeptide (TPR) repeat protein